MWRGFRGRPNAGKSSLLNALAGREAAIVTDIAGTTRDVLREHIHIDGMPLHIIDTAGLRESSDEVEKIGIERAWQEIAQADHVLFMVDGTTTPATDPQEIWPDFVARLPQALPVTVIRNKADVTADSVARRSCQTALWHIAEALVRWMAPIMSFTADEIWGHLSAERREVAVDVEYVGFTIPDEFVVGYGIDYAQRYRHLPYVGKVVILEP